MFRGFVVAQHPFIFKLSVTPAVLKRLQNHSAFSDGRNKSAGWVYLECLCIGEPDGKKQHESFIFVQNQLQYASVYAYK